MQWPTTISVPAASSVPAIGAPYRIASGGCCGGWRAARYGNEAVLPFYLLHEPVIVATAWFIVRWNAPVLPQYAALVAVSFAVTLALYDLAVRRFRPARFLLGMKQRRSTW